MFVLRSLGKVAVVSKTGEILAGLNLALTFSFSYRIMGDSSNKSATVCCTAAAVKGLHVFIQKAGVVEG
jgi:uncharacterized membrane-anchored protein